MPDDAGHLVAVHLDDRILHCNLRHGGRAFACVFARADVCRTWTECPWGRRLMARPAASCKDKTRADLRPRM
jgi:hypothetical protein